MSARILFLQADDAPPSDMATVKQVHGDGIIAATGTGLQGEADALITNTPGLWLGIQTADCLPVVLDAAPHAVGIAHAGWKGVYSAICPKMVRVLCQQYGVLPADIQVHIGPHISQQHYEVGTEFFDYFAATYFDGRHLDLQAVVTDQLLDSGILPAHIHPTHTCTFADQRYNSYRRDKTAGRQWSCVSTVIK